MSTRREDLDKGKEEPWSDHGLHLGVKITTNSLGWTLLRPRGTRIIKEGRRGIGLDSHEQAALNQWKRAGCPKHVVFYKYATEEAYRRSRDKGGMKRSQHGELVDRVAAVLRRHGASVDIQVVEY